MSEVSTSDWFLQLLDHRHFLPAAGMLVGVVAIVAAATVVIVLSKVWASHRQRMTMIARGMHPDAILDEIADEPPAASGGA